MNNLLININAYQTLYSFLDDQQEKPYGIKVWGETTQTFWFATHEERNAVADTLTALAQDESSRVAQWPKKIWTRLISGGSAFSPNRPNERERTQRECSGATLTKKKSLWALFIGQWLMHDQKSGQGSRARPTKRRRSDGLSKFRLSDFFYASSIGYVKPMTYLRWHTVHILPAVHILPIAPLGYFRI